MSNLQKDLFEMQDVSYRDFHSRLIPDIDKENIIGIRVPELRKFAKQYKYEEVADNFLKVLPHKYYEENQLHMMIISEIKDYDVCMAEIKKFLPYVNNWATCDLPRPKCFAENKGILLSEIKEWIKSDKTYTIRYGIGTLMSLYLDADFDEEFLWLVAGVSVDEYYVNMMLAWYFATALAKQWDAAIPFIEEKRLSEWVHKKTIQKAVESYRISDEHKEYLRGLR